MPKQRNYKAEYERRIARGLTRGLTRSQARGHPEAGRAFVSGKHSLTSYDKELEEGIKRIHKGESLQAAARSIHVTAERLKRYVIGQNIGEKHRGRWTIGQDNRKRVVMLFSGGKEHTIIVDGYERAKQVGSYMQAVKQFMETNDASVLNPFRGQVIHDTKGKRYLFETNENLLYKLNLTSDSTFEQIYRIVA